MTLRVGTKVANFGPDAHLLAEAAIACEEAGADSLWLSDRVVTVPSPTAAYPFTDDGTVPWTSETPFVDSIVAMATIAAVTHRAEIGTGVLVLPLRSPLVLAKQLASVDALSGGRVILGVGAGWMAEEYDLLGVPYAERGARTDEAVTVLRACWQDQPPAVAGRYYSVPAGLGTRPVPAHRIPILVGGMTPAALRRAGRLDGWYGYIQADRLSVPDVAAALAVVRAARSEREARSGGAGAGAAGAGAGGGVPRDVLRLVGSPDVAAGAARDLVSAGITEVVIDVDWRNLERARQEIERVRDGAASDTAVADTAVAEAASARLSSGQAR